MNGPQIGGGEVEPRRAAWAYLSSVVLGPCAPLSGLIEMVGVVEAARAVREWDLPESLRNRTEARHGVDNSARDLGLMERLGGRLVTPDDPEWPAWRLLSFAQLDPTQGSSAMVGAHLNGGEPIALWVLGDSSPAELSDRAIAVVGTRAASPYGVRVTEDMVAEFASRGWTVVSGAAFGIDAAAHRAALACGAPTVAVLACGVDRPYPAGHSRLLREISQKGLVVSEYPPGTAPAKGRFLVRNRLVAALSEAVLVTEAGRRSGARNTASWARRLGRPALAVPGSVLSATSVGCNRMIADGEAFLVADAREVFDLVSPREVCGTGGFQTSLPIVANGQVRPTDLLSEDELRVYDALPAVGSRTVREISLAAGVTLPDVRATLPVLELRGFVGSDSSGWYRKVVKNRGDASGKLV